MATTNKRLVDSKGAASILNSRVTVSRQHVGDQVVLLIQGDGTFVSAQEQRDMDATAGKEPAANYFDKRIHNVKANSAEAMSRKETKALLAQAMKAETAGQVEEANDLFNQWLNACQLSFNVIVNDGQRQLQDGDQITAIIGEADTKLGYRALTINTPRYKKPATVDKVAFNLTDLLGDMDENPADEVTTKANAKAGAPKAGAPKAGKK